MSAAWRARARARRGGFTLLEVMIAIAILGLGLTAIFASEAGAIKTAYRARKLQVASLLARCKMGELEEQLAEQGLPAVEAKGSDGCCADAEMDGFECDWRVERIELPDPVDLEDGEGAVGLPGGGTEEGGRTASVDEAAALGVGGSVDEMLAGGMSGGVIDSIALTYAYPILKPALEEQVRRVTVTVRWREGEGDRSFDVGRFVVAERGAVQAGSTEALEQALDAAGGGRAP